MPECVHFWLGAVLQYKDRVSMLFQMTAGRADIEYVDEIYFGIDE